MDVMGGHRRESYCWSSRIIRRATEKQLCGQIKIKLRRLEGTRKTHHTITKSNILTSVKYGGGDILLWGCFASSEAGQKASRMEKWIARLTSTFCGRNQDFLYANWSLTEDGWWKRTMAQRRKVNHQQKSFVRWKYGLWCDTVESPDHNLIEMLWHDRKRMIHTDIPRTWQSGNIFAKRNGPKFLLAGLICNCR